MNRPPEVLGTAGAHPNRTATRQGGTARTRRQPDEDSPGLAGPPGERSVRPSAVGEAAGRLRAAALRHQPCPPVRDLIGRDDVAAAYAVQQQLTAG